MMKVPRGITGKRQQQLFKKKRGERVSGSDALEFTLLALKQEMSISADEFGELADRVRSEITHKGERADWCLLTAMAIWKSGFEYQRNVRLFSEQHYAFDFGIIHHSEPARIRAAIEIDGGQFIKGGGRHQRGAEWQKNIEDRNACQASGIPVFVFVTSHFLRAPQYVIKTIQQIAKIAEDK